MPLPLPALATAAVHATPPRTSTTTTPRTSTTPRTNTTATFLSTLPLHVWQSLVVEADLKLSLLTHEGRLLRGIDSSEETMGKAFDVLDRKGTGYLDHDQFAEGLNRCLLAFGGAPLPKAFTSLETLWVGVSSTGPQEATRRISREAFGLVIRRLKMEVLLLPIHADTPASSSSRSTVTLGGSDGISGGGGGSGNMDEDVVMKVFDFTKHSMYKWNVLENRARDFFLTKHVPNIVLKWIVVST